MSIEVKIGVNNSELEQGLKKSENTAKQSLNNIGKEAEKTSNTVGKLNEAFNASTEAVKGNFSGISKMFGGISKIFSAVGAGIVAMGAGISAAFKGMKDLSLKLDGIAKGAKSVEMTGEAYQSLSHACNRSGVEMDKVLTLITKIDYAIIRAEGGEKKYIDAWRSLNISWKELEKLSPERRLEAINRELLKYKNAGMTMPTGVMDIFGKKDLQTLNKMQAEDFFKTMNLAKSQGYVISEKALKIAESYADSLGDVNEKLLAMVSNMDAVQEAMDKIAKLRNKAFGGYTGNPYMFEETGGQMMGYGDKLKDLVKNDKLTRDQINDLLNSLNISGISKAIGMFGEASLAVNADTGLDYNESKKRLLKAIDDKRFNEDFNFKAKNLVSKYDIRFDKNPDTNAYETGNNPNVNITPEQIIMDEAKKPIIDRQLEYAKSLDIDKSVDDIINKEAQSFENLGKSIETVLLDLQDLEKQKAQMAGKDVKGFDKTAEELLKEHRDSLRAEIMASQEQGLIPTYDKIEQVNNVNKQQLGKLNQGIFTTILENIAQGVDFNALKTAISNESDIFYDGKTKWPKYLDYYIDNYIENYLRTRTDKIVDKDKLRSDILEGTDTDIEYWRKISKDIVNISKNIDENQISYLMDYYITNYIENYIDKMANKNVDVKKLRSDILTNPDMYNVIWQKAADRYFNTNYQSPSDIKHFWKGETVKNASNALKTANSEYVTDDEVLNEMFKNDYNKESSIKEFKKNYYKTIEYLQNLPDFHNEIPDDMALNNFLSEKNFPTVKNLAGLFDYTKTLKKMINDKSQYNISAADEDLKSVKRFYDEMKNNVDISKDDLEKATNSYTAALNSLVSTDEGLITLASLLKSENPTVSKEMLQGSFNTIQKTINDKKGVIVENADDIINLAENIKRGKEDLIIQLNNIIANTGRNSLVDKQAKELEATSIMRLNELKSQFIKNINAIDDKIKLYEAENSNDRESIIKLKTINALKEKGLKISDYNIRELKQFVTKFNDVEKKDKFTRLYNDTALKKDTSILKSNAEIYKDFSRFGYSDNLNRSAFMLEQGFSKNEVRDYNRYKSLYNNRNLSDRNINFRDPREKTAYGYMMEAKLADNVTSQKELRNIFMERLKEQFFNPNNVDPNYTNFNNLIKSDKMFNFNNLVQRKENTTNFITDLNDKKKNFAANSLYDFDERKLFISSSIDKAQQMYGRRFNGREQKLMYNLYDLEYNLTNAKQPVYKERQTIYSNDLAARGGFSSSVVVDRSKSDNAIKEFKKKYEENSKNFAILINKIAGALTGDM